MIKIFSGEWRGLGSVESGCGMILDFHFREILHHFRGARLAIFMCIALHCDKNGESYPSYDTIEAETGYTQDTISEIISQLTAMRIDGHRVLAVFRKRDERGCFIGNNHYLIFPGDGDEGIKPPVAKRGEGTELNSDNSQVRSQAEFGLALAEVKPSTELNQGKDSLKDAKPQNASEPQADSHVESPINNADNPDGIGKDQPAPGQAGWQPDEADAFGGLFGTSSRPKSLTNENSPAEGETAEDRHRARVLAALDRHNQRRADAEVDVDVSFFPEYARPYALAFASAAGFRPIRRDLAFWLKEIKYQIELDLTPEDIKAATTSAIESKLTLKSPGSVTGIARNDKAAKERGVVTPGQGVVKSQDGGLYV